MAPHFRAEGAKISVVPYVYATLVQKGLMDPEGVLFLQYNLSGTASVIHPSQSFYFETGFIVSKEV